MRPHRDTETIGSLAGRLIADGKIYVTATVETYKQKAFAWVPPIRTAAILVILALFLAQAAITTLLVFIGFWLALWLGPLGGGVAACVIALVVAGILVKLAINQFAVSPVGASR